MKFSEFLNGRDIFGAVQTFEPFPFITDKEGTLNAMLLINYGERMVFDPYENLSDEEVAEILVAEFSETWLTYVEQASLIQQVHSETERTRTLEGGENRSGERNDLNKKAAYNDPDLLVEGGSDSSNSEEVERTENVVEKTVEKDIAKAYSLLDSSVKQSIIRKVIKDVSTMLTIDIY